MKRKVIRIIDGDTFEVAPDWEWEGQAGSIVRPIGYDTPEWREPGYSQAKGKLKRLILNKEVELKDPIKLSYERLLCYVIFQGKDLAGYFI